MGPDELHSLSRAFMESRILLTAVELSVFDAVQETATAADVASNLSLNTRAVESLLNALVSMNLLEKESDTYSLSNDSSRYLLSSSPDNLLGSIYHSASLWKRWNTLNEALAAGTSVYERLRGEKDTEAFIAAMHRNASRRAPQITNALGLTGPIRILDIGGGSGAYSISLAQNNPDLKAVIFDRPEVTPITQRHINEAGLDNRVSVCSGDMLEDEFGAEGSYDVVFLFAICHMFGPERNRLLFRKAQSALKPGGRIFIQDFVLDDTKTDPKHAAVFALHMLVATQDGSTYSGEEYCRWLEESGFSNCHVMPIAGPTDLVTGTKLK